jgi:hypothetical protein
MKIRRRTIEHVFGTLKYWMGSAHFLMKTLVHVPTEISLHALACNLKRVINVLGIAKTMKAMKLAGARALCYADSLEISSGHCEDAHIWPLNALDGAEAQLRSSIASPTSIRIQ